MFEAKVHRSLDLSHSEETLIDEEMETESEAEMSIEEQAISHKNDANECFKSKHYLDSIPHYSKAIELMPKNATFYGNRAAAYLMVCDYVKSLSDCMRAIELDPGFVKAHFRAAKCFVHLGQLDEALAQLGVLKRIGGNSISDCLEKTHAETREIESLSRWIAKSKSERESNPKGSLNSLETACIVLDSSLARSGRSGLSNLDSALMFRIPVSWRLERAHLLIVCGDIDEASKVSAMLLRENSQNTDAMYLRAKTMFLLDSHPTETIIKFLRQALQFDPDYTTARDYMKFVKALESFKVLGNEAFKNGEYQAALEAYSNFLEKSEGVKCIPSAKVYSNRANVYSKLGQDQESIHDVKQSLEMLDAVSFTTLAVSMEDREHSVSSSLYLKLYLRRANCLLKLEKYEEGIRDFEAALVFKPNDREIRSALSSAQRDLKLSKRKDYYKILGITKTATSIEIKKAFRSMALVHHPDKQVCNTDEQRESADNKFKEINEAYSVLSDESKKSQYDNGTLMDGGSASAGQSQNPFGDSDIFEMFGRGGFGQQQRGFGGSGFGGHSHGGFSHGGFHFG